jgi:cytochrome c553
MSGPLFFDRTIFTTDCYSMKTIFFLAALTLAAAQSAWAGDPEAGKVKAAQCAVCHGTNGLSVLAEAPNLAGQPEMYLVQQLVNYRSGRRPHEVMAILAKPLTTKEIEDLAAWYSSMKIEVK